MESKGLSTERLKSKRKPASWGNLAIGATIQLAEVSTLGQPFEVVKTTMVAHRSDSLADAVKRVYARGGIPAFWTGLIPWAWIEAGTKGAVLFFAANELDYLLRNANLPLGVVGALSGSGGGLAQAYTTMGFCTFMKTVEVTRAKGSRLSTWQVAAGVIKKDGVSGLYRGVNAVALRQMTNWGSRMGIARWTESLFSRLRSNRSSSSQDQKPTTAERLAASVVAGALATWNQPIEVIRVEMQSHAADSISRNTAARPSMWNTAQHIYFTHGIRGFYRGVVPRVGLSVYLTVCMVFCGDHVKEWFAAKKKKETMKAGDT